MPRGPRKFSRVYMVSAVVSGVRVVVGSFSATTTGRAILSARSAGVMRGVAPETVFSDWFATELIGSHEAKGWTLDTTTLRESVDMDFPRPESCR